MTFTPIGAEQKAMYQVAKYLIKRYTCWTADLVPLNHPTKAGMQTRGIPYVKWNDDGARDAYYLLCSLYDLPREA